MGAFEDPPWVVGNNNRIIGGFRILQHRVAPDKCCQVFSQWTDPFIKKYGDRAPFKCYGDYDPSCADKEPFGVSVIYNNKTTKKYGFMEKCHMMAGTDGRFAKYDGKGFPLDFNQVWDPKATAALEGIKELEVW